MHPNHAHMTQAAQDPEAALARRIEVARQSGVPEEPLRRYAEQRKGQGFGIAALVEPDHELVEGVTLDSDLGPWHVYETPGHAPSHVCLFQPDRRLLISGDHLLGRVSPYYDYGWSPDPAGEFLDSLDKVDRLGARLCLSGHGRPFTDVHGHVEANRELVGQRLDSAAAALDGEPRTAVDIAPDVFGEPLNALSAAWRLSETLAYLTHLERAARVKRLEGEPLRWERT
jgi:glyoxylase-like metal-dependent hydrolase (beta-lactamase superfamily II)